MMTSEARANATKPLPKPSKWLAGTDATDSAQNGSNRPWLEFIKAVATIETMAALFGMAGALLLAMPAMPAWGFGAFLVSNIGWLQFSAAHGYRRFFVQQLVFLACSLLGLWNWWLGPLLFPVLG